MIVVRCLMARQGRQSLCVGEIRCNRLRLRRPIALEPQEIVSAPLHDQCGGLVLAVKSVGGHEMAGQVETAKQGSGRHNLALSVTGAKAFLTDHDARGRCERGHDGQWRALCRPVEGAAERLAVNGKNALTLHDSPISAFQTVPAGKCVFGAVSEQVSEVIEADAEP